MEKESFITGRTAIATGAGSGRGRATAATLARAGAAVAIQARRQDRLNKSTSEIAAQEDKALAVGGYDEENFSKAVAPFGQPLEPQVIADGIHCLLRLPPHVNVNEVAIRPTGQIFPQEAL